MVLRFQPDLVDAVDPLADPEVIVNLRLRSRAVIAVRVHFINVAAPLDLRIDERNEVLECGIVVRSFLMPGSCARTMKRRTRAIWTTVSLSQPDARSRPFHSAMIWTRPMPASRTWSSSRSSHSSGSPGYPQGYSPKL